MIEPEPAPATPTSRFGATLRTLMLVVVLMSLYLLISRWGAVLALGRDIERTFSG